MKNSNHLIIMAGGVGNRFWPVSTREKPKQFIDVLGCGKSLLQLTVDHFKGICPIENIWVVTSEEYADIVREPHKLLITQMNGEKTTLDTDAVHIEMKSGKGSSNVLVLMGNDITSIRKI